MLTSDRNRPKVKPPPDLPKFGTFKVIPIRYVRNSGQVLVQYVEGPQAGKQATVPFSALTHQNGDYEVVKQVRRVRSNS